MITLHLRLYRVSILCPPWARRTTLFGFTMSKHSYNLPLPPDSPEPACNSPAWAHRGTQVCSACPGAGISGAAWPAFPSESEKPLKKSGRDLRDSQAPPSTHHLAAQGQAFASPIWVGTQKFFHRDLSQRAGLSFPKAQRGIFNCPKMAKAA